jgi:PleD family two-component response regulator
LVCDWITPGKGEQQMVHALGAAPIRALIVEDNRGICENIAAYLEKHGYVMDSAYDGISAMHLALTNTFDVIVLDLMFTNNWCSEFPLA